MFKLLLKEPVDVRARDEMRNTALHLVADRGPHWKSQGQSKITFTEDRSTENEVDAKLTQLLLENGANLDATNLYGKTPLCLAIESEKDRLTKLLISSGARLLLRKRLTISGLLVDDFKPDGLEYFIYVNSYEEPYCDTKKEQLVEHVIRKGEHEALLKIHGFLARNYGSRFHDVDASPFPKESRALEDQLMSIHENFLETGRKPKS
ncbi:hypothetical protein MMC28_006396 [Mycoblastus sanguinarius]|nr:hypothetical protein [Mycoblastus sanguinarius]